MVKAEGTDEATVPGNFNFVVDSEICENPALDFIEKKVAANDISRIPEFDGQGNKDVAQANREVTV
jgi:hypothetical protein